MCVGASCEAPRMTIPQTRRGSWFFLINTGAKTPTLEKSKGLSCRVCTIIQALQVKGESQKIES